MAWVPPKEPGPLRIEFDGASRPDGQVVVSAILINVLSPKLSILFFAILPQFVGVNV